MHCVNLSSTTLCCFIKEKIKASNFAWLTSTCFTCGRSKVGQESKGQHPLLQLRVCSAAQLYRPSAWGWATQRPPGTSHIKLVERSHFSFGNRIEFLGLVDPDVSLSWGLEGKNSRIKTISIISCDEMRTKGNECHLKTSA